MRRLARAVLLIACAAGCATQRPPAPPPAAEGPIPDAAALLDAVAVRRERLHSLRAMARCAFRSPAESHRARQLILAARPDRLRLEIFSPLGTVFVLAASQGALTAYAPSEGIAYRGAASGANLARYANVDLPVPTAVDLVLGTPPIPDDGLTVVSRDDGYTKLWQMTGDDVRVAWFGAHLDPVRYEERAADGQVLVRATFADFADVDGVRLPRQLSIELPPSQRRIDIELREPEVNPALADTLFVLAPPPGSREIDLDQVVD